METEGFSDFAFSSVNMKNRFSARTCKVLNEMRQKGQLCDAVLVAEDASFPVHKIIMCGCSPYFKALFSNGMNETQQREVLMPDVPADLMETIIDYAYNGEVTVSKENIEGLLPVADQFLIHGLMTQCCQFLSDSICLENVVGIHNFAKNYFCLELERNAHKYIMENFIEIAKNSSEILKLSPQEFKELILSDELNVKSEDVVFEAICRWISHEAQTRKPLIKELLQCMRLRLLTTQYFVETIKTHPYVSENADCRSLVIDTLKFIYDLDLDKTKVDYNHPLARPRVPHEVMFAVGGWSGGSPTNIIEAYNARTDKWTKLKKAFRDTSPRAYHGCAAVGTLIYVIGGFDGFDYFNTVRCFDLVTKTWSEKAPMYFRRCYVSAAVLNGCIYALGGMVLSGQQQLRHSSAEKYEPKSNQWSLISPMHHQRSDASATALGGKLYIAGGFNGHECLDAAESYDPKTNQWTLITPMTSRRSGVGVIAHGGFVYAIGGFNGTGRMKHGERYDPETKTWTRISEMGSPRSNFGIAVLDDMVYALGGFNGMTTIYNVECYDASTGEWYECVEMNLFRSALSVCVVTGLPNIRDYVHKHRTTPADRCQSAAPSDVDCRTLMD